MIHKLRFAVDTRPATSLGLLGIRATFGGDEFEGELVALNIPALTGHLQARRLKTDRNLNRKQPAEP